MTDPDMIAKTDALAKQINNALRADPACNGRVTNDTVRWIARLLCESAAPEHEPSEARRVWDAAYEAAERSHGGELDDNATAIIEAALAKAEERGAQREREAFMRAVQLPAAIRARGAL